MVELLVEKMRCGGCAGRVKKAIQSVDSEASIDINLASKTVQVSTGADGSAVANAVTAAGYPVLSCKMMP